MFGLMGVGFVDGEWERGTDFLEKDIEGVQGVEETLAQVKVDNRRNVHPFPKVGPSFTVPGCDRKFGSFGSLKFYQEASHAQIFLPVVTSMNENAQH